MASAGVTIGVVGAGGDGVVVLGSYVQRLAAAQGYYSQMPRYYGAQIRGGGSAVKLGIWDDPAQTPRESLDILICFAWDKYPEFRRELTLRPDTLVICEKRGEPAHGAPAESFEVDLSKVSEQSTGATQNKNIVALGLLARVLGLPQTLLDAAIAQDDELLLLRRNPAALDAGAALFSRIGLPELRLAPALDPAPKLVLHGNSAVRMGAMRAGCRAFFGYPITPASEIMQEMREELSRTDGVFLQSESEIAAVGMVIGASLTGAKAMTATSGAGLDLMTESIGLASAAEIPLVIVNVQRCGPSTGIPSKSEQSDLSHALWGGHGDAPRVVLAPYDTEGCCRLMMESIGIAERYQTPVILLSDQWLGQTFAAVREDFLGESRPVSQRKRPPEEEAGPYRRYEITDDSISPWASAGDAGYVHQITGLNHAEDGAPAFDAETQLRMHEKIRRKLTPLADRRDLVKIFGDEGCTRGVVTWGSTAQPVLSTIRELGLADRVRVCIPELIHPLPTGLTEFLKSMDRLLVIEMNHSGQLYRYLRSEVNLPEDSRVYSRPGGRPFSVTELTGPIKGVAE